jgi:hypothetical protein
MASFMLSHFSYFLFSHLAMLAEVTRVQETTATMEATHVAAMLTAETSTREPIVVRDSATLYERDVENQAALAEREALDKVSRVEVENATLLASAHEDAEGLARKFALFEDNLAAEHRAREVSERERREQFEELTLL